MTEKEDEVERLTKELAQVHDVLDQHAEALAEKNTKIQQLEQERSLLKAALQRQEALPDVVEAERLVHQKAAAAYERLLLAVVREAVRREPE